MFSDYSKTPLNREEHKKIVRIIHNLLNMNESVSFRKPVCYRALGLEDYKDIVKKPIDLNMIRRNNNEWVYKFIEEVFDDIQLCWDNCRIYNRPGSDIYQCAVKMEQNFVEEIMKQYPSFVIPSGIIKGRQTFTDNYSYSTYIRPEQKEKNLSQINTEKNNNTQIYQQQNQSGQPERDMEVELRPQYKKPSKKQNKPKINQKIPQQQIYGYPEEEEVDGEVSINQQMRVQQVEPITITFPEHPSQAGIIALGERIKLVRNQRDIIRGVLRIIQEDQKTSIQETGENKFSFEASKMKFGTYVRINKFLDVATKM